jgi:hypothetical protein
MAQAWDTDNSIQNNAAAPSVRIIVATHKKYRMPDDPMYLPLHIGAAVEKNGNGLEPDLGYEKDNTGENISVRNPTFCELTGLFWAWKHVDADYIGLVHYRRYFKGKGRGKDPFDRILKEEELRPLLGRYQVFLPRKQYYVIETLYSHYAHTHYIEHLDKTRQILEENYPEYLPAFDKVMKQRSGHMFNMMICRRDILDEYCRWLFPILFALQDRVNVRNYSYFQGRYCGRVGEIILNVWIEHALETGRLQKNDIRTLPYLYTEKINWWRKGTRFLKAKFMNTKYEV